MSDDWRNDPRFKSSAEDEKQYQKDKKKDAKYTKIGLIVLSIPIIGFFGLGLLGMLWNNFYDLGSFAKLVPVPCPSVKAVYSSKRLDLTPLW